MATKNKSIFSKIGTWVKGVVTDPEERKMLIDKVKGIWEMIS